MAEEKACIYKDGPNQVIPAEEYSTSNPDGAVKLRIPKSGNALETEPALSIPGLLHRSALNYPNHAALCSQNEDGTWNKITYSEYQKMARQCAKAFLKLGLQRHHSVCILGFNSVEWFISDLGAIHAGGFAAGIYTTNSSEACFHVAESSRANIIVVEDNEQLQKILKIRSKLPLLKAIVQYTGKPTEPGVLSWSELLEIGAKESDDMLDNALKRVASNECCTLVYTSGTVGNPKAVMLSHDNLVWDAFSINQRFNFQHGKEVIISFLPLSHVAAQLVDIYLVMTMAGTIYFADRNAFKGTLVKTLVAVQPTRFLGVPRVWEKIHEKMMQVASQNGPVKAAIAAWAKEQALKHYTDKMQGIDSKSWGYTVASSVIFKKVKQALGFTRCKTFVTAAAPLSPHIKKYFMSLDMPIYEAFGMSEAAGAHTIAYDNAFGLDTIGPALPGTKSKFVNPDNKGHGELCLIGRHVFMGYLNEPEKTAEAIDSNGWLHSGDVGYADNKNMIYITGRIKELLITAGGENVPPVPIEQLVASMLPNISNCILIGDQKKFLSMLISLKTEVDADTGKPSDVLLGEVQEWLNEIGCPATTVTEVLAAGPHPNLLKEIQNGLDKANEKATSNAQKIQKFAIIHRELSIATGELGPTLKMKRNIVMEKFKDTIDKIYA